MLHPVAHTRQTTVIFAGTGLMLAHVYPLPSFVIDIIRLSLWLAILVGVFVPLERLFAAHGQPLLRRGLGADLGYYFLNGLFVTAILAVPLGLLAWVIHQAVPSGFLATMAGLPIWVRILVALVLGDIGGYWGHRWSHEIPLLWRFHAIHHSAENIDFLVNTRAHPADMVFGHFCALVPIYIAGLGGPVGAAGSIVPITVVLVGTVWSFFIHANLRFRYGPLEWLVSSPAFHHWHHTLTGPVNHNYAAMLPWVDRIFGTHYLPRREFPAAYGIATPMPDNLAAQLIYPLQTQLPLTTAEAATR